VKGGRLAAAAGRATKITLAVTDVPAEQESALASGPTLPDPTTIADVDRILSEFKMLRQFPPSLRRCVEEGRLSETPKEKTPRSLTRILPCSWAWTICFHPAHCASEAKGFFTCCDNLTDDWPVEKAAEYLLAQLNALQAAHPSHRVALIADGEVSSPVIGDGIGGRNSAFVLACVENIVGRRVAVLSAGTDGIDGNSPAAGAVADGETMGRAMAAGLDPGDAFRRSDAFTFFRAAERRRHHWPDGKPFAGLENFAFRALGLAAKGNAIFLFLGEIALDRFSRSLISCRRCSSLSRRCATPCSPASPLFRRQLLRRRPLCHCRLSAVARFAA